MIIYDIAVVGAGPAGIMAAIRAGQLGRKVALIERNAGLGAKLMITGKGRCNITNSADLDAFIKKFGKKGEFLRTAFFDFSNQDLIEFFKARGLELKTERQGRVFPETDKAASIIEALNEYLEENKVEILYNTRVIDIKRTGDWFKLKTESGNELQAGKVILSTGGASYKVTGSTGDGFVIAEKFGHKITGLTPGLVPLKTKEAWVSQLQGLALENIRLTFEYGKKKITSEIGELIFTHFGVSGPLILDLSQEIVAIIKERGEVRLFIDLKPGLKVEQLESKLLHKFTIKGNIYLKNLLKDLLPQRLVEVFIKLMGTIPEVKTNQIRKEERQSIIRLLKAFPLTITGSLPLEEAMVTAGGVSLKDINPRTMGSKIVAGLYFAGEVIEGAAPSGGYNLQQAFSTGYLAGESAGNA